MLAISEIVLTSGIVLAIIYFEVRLLYAKPKQQNN